MDTCNYTYISTRYMYNYMSIYTFIIFYLKNTRRINFRRFRKNYNIKNDTLKELELQRVYNYEIYPRD